MLQTRLWMGALLVALTVGMLAVDQNLGPWHPFLFVLLLALAGAACHELLHLLPADRRPSAWFCYISVFALLLANWPVHVWTASFSAYRDPWHWILSVLAVVILGVFLAEMANFQRTEQSPGASLTRIALTLWIAVYLGLLPSFLAQLRWPGDASGDLDGQCGPSSLAGTLSLALAIFVPKCCDIGAYFTGRLLGRHPMAPVLSPKKTWEGAAGGLATAVIAAVGINRLGPVLQHGFWEEAGFGLTVGAAGMLGDLAESLIKRDCRHKDASQAVPGFGGVLDVIDAVLFAAPVAYVWIAISQSYWYCGFTLSK